MIYPDVPLAEWVERHHIDATKLEPCGGCGKPFPPGRPALMKGYAGLEFVCPCKGKYSTAAIFTPNKPETRSFWRRVMSGPFF